MISGWWLTPMQGAFGSTGGAGALGSAGGGAGALGSAAGGAGASGGGGPLRNVLPAGGGGGGGGVGSALATDGSASTTTEALVSAAIASDFGRPLRCSG